MSKNPLPVAIGSIAVAAFAYFECQKPAPGPSQYKLVSGTVSSASATNSTKGDHWNIKVWLVETPELSYHLYQDIPERLLGTFDAHPGSKVQMLCSQKDLETPDRGILHNVDPFVQAASLDVDGRQISSWDDFVKSWEQNRKDGKGLAYGFGGLGLFLLVGAFRRQSKPAYVR